MAASAVIIQRWYRRILSKRQLLRTQYDEWVKIEHTSRYSGVELFKIGLKIQSFYVRGIDTLRLRQFCRIIMSSMDTDIVKSWYVSVSLDKDHSVQWIKQVKWILLMSGKSLYGLKPGMPRDDQYIETFLSIIVLLTDSTLWKLSQKGGDALKPTLIKLCSSFSSHLIDNGIFRCFKDILISGLAHPRIKFTKNTIQASVGLRLLSINGFNSKYLIHFIKDILTIPGLIYHINLMSPQTLLNLKKHNFSNGCLKSLNDNFNDIVKDKDKTEILSLMSNMIQLKSLDNDDNKDSIELYLSLLSLMKGNNTTNSTSTIWHLVFGWIDFINDKRLLDCLCHLRSQLSLLWSSSLIKTLFEPLYAMSLTEGGGGGGGKRSDGGAQSRVKKLFNISSQRVNKMADSDISNIYRSCRLYHEILSVLPQLSTDVLIGLSSDGYFCSRLCHFLFDVLSIDTRRSALDLINDTESVSALTLMCQTTNYLLSILDDGELYTQQQYFTLQQLERLTMFINNVIFYCIWEQQHADSALVQCTHSCLVLLLQRNQRKSFLPPDSLLIKQLKVSKFITEWKTLSMRSVQLLQKLPHIIPHNKRVEIFYEYIKNDKAMLGIGCGHGHTPATYITIHRNRLLEDGYNQLVSVSTPNMKGVVRVKFVNEQGLDEAGIDEMGVFKEFLEEIVKEAFNPSFGLFKANSEGSLYPSPTSNCHDNHLIIFEFLGKILGKAVYEGIVLDLPFCIFFLHYLTKQSHGILYSSLDELHTLDPELSKSLHFIKHYDGDVADLCLTFSYEENFLGKLITYELIPGGSVIPVTAENKISYVHKLAHYKLSTQIKDQTNAFVKGFHSIISPKWMEMFSAREFQRVISGDDSDIDIDQLRKCTRYYGGYHDSHRVIQWLWDLLRNEFTLEQRSCFLKFVTSCSRQPLLGFDTLDPPFSIRRVDTPSEEEAIHVTGVIKTLFGVRTHKERLPTSSTCFNLLKLPDYNKRNILKDKLLQAITSNAGFELS